MYFKPYVPTRTSAECSGQRKKDDEHSSDGHVGPYQLWWRQARFWLVIHLWSVHESIPVSRHLRRRLQQAGPTAAAHLRQIRDLLAKPVAAVHRCVKQLDHHIRDRLELDQLVALRHRQLPRSNGPRMLSSAEPPVGNESQRVILAGPRIILK